MGFLDNYVNNLTDSSMGPYSLTDEDRKKLKKRGLLQAGLALLSTPTGQGGVFQALGKGLLSGAGAVQDGGQDMMKQKYQADVMARQKAEFDKQKLIDGLAQKHRMPDGSLNMEALRNDLISIDPVKYAGVDNTGIQSSFQGADGNMYALTRDGQVKNLGVKFNPSLQYKVDSNNNPFAFDKTTGSMAPVGAPAQNQNVVQMPSYDPKAVRTQMQSVAMQFPNVKASSFLRSPKHNAEVGGVPNSQHISGTAGDFVVPNDTKPSFIAAARAKGFEAIDEGDHVHLELPPSAQRGPNGFAARKPEDIKGAEARAAAQAQAEVQLATAPAIEAAKTIASETGKANAAKIINAPKVESDANSLIGLLDKAINHPQRAASTGASAANPLNNMWGSGTRDFNVLMEQIKGKTFLEAFNSLRGAGAITEKEGDAATKAIARLDMAQSEGAFLDALNELKGIVAKAKESALRPVGQKPPSKDGWSIQRVQ